MSESHLLRRQQVFAELLENCPSSNTNVKTLTRNWTAFEGFANNPPGILIGNEYVTLTSEHNVCFLMNPKSYGGERQEPSLFKRQASYVAFQPLPLEYIYNEVLQPIFSRYHFNPIELATPLLELADFLNKYSTSKVLISPRELGMMAQLIIAHCHDNPGANPLDVAQHYVHSIGTNLVPDEFKTLFTNTFPEKPIFRKEVKTVDDLLITPNNKVVVDTLHDFLKVRELRQKDDTLAPNGLGGFIVEGPPGIGKTELIAKSLVSKGFKKGNINQDNSNEPTFYTMQASLPLAEKEALLYKAFREGAIVVIDEINSTSMMERLLNDLLMGKTPDGAPPKKQGFMIIGTQNPSTMAGRIKASLALQRRMLTVALSNYPEQEMNDILLHKGLDKPTSSAMIAEYLSRIDLCFRDLLNKAEQLIRGKAQQPGSDKKCTHQPTDEKTQPNDGKMEIETRKRTSPEPEEEQHPSKKMRFTEATQSSLIHTSAGFFNQANKRKRQDFEYQSDSDVSKKNTLNLT